MIEDELRAVFERREDLVPSAAPLVEKINEGARQRRRRRRIARSSMAVAVAVALIAAGPVMTRTFLATPPVPTDTTAPTPAPTEPPIVPLAGRPANLLVAISGLGRSGKKDVHSVGLVHVSADRKNLNVIALPGVAQVEVPGHGKLKLEDAYDIGGFGLLDTALARVSGLTFDGTITIDLPALVKAVDDLGGMHICYGNREYHRVYNSRPWPFPAGCLTVSGEDAMEYATYYGHGAQYMLPPGFNFSAALLRNIVRGGGLGDADDFARFTDAFRSAVSIDLRGHTAQEFRDLIGPNAELTAVTVKPGYDKTFEEIQRDGEPTEFVMPAAVVTPLFAALREDRVWDDRLVRPVDPDPLRELFPGDGDWPPGTDNE
jgi:hypothetical protein